MGLKRNIEQKWEDSMYGELGPLMKTGHDWGDWLEFNGFEFPECGVRIGKGWEAHVKELIGKLVAMGWDKDIRQIKEKFGSLRFYVGKATDEMRTLIHDYEAATATMCEACGEAGKIAAHDGGYNLMCLCETHAKMYANRKNYIRPGYTK